MVISRCRQQQQLNREKKKKKLTDWWKQDLWKKMTQRARLKVERENMKRERERRPGLTGGDEKELLTD